MAVPTKPLMLKDFLELDENADSGNGATVRSLIEAEVLVRSRTSKGALTMISNTIRNVVMGLQPMMPSPTKTKRSLSEKVAAGRRRRSFWKRGSAKGEGQADVADKVREKDIVRFPPPPPPPPPPPYLASSCSSCSTSSSRHSTSFSGSDFVLSSSGSFDCPEYLGEAAGRDIAGVADAALLSGPHHETKEIMKKKEVECCGYQSEEETEQLSPVSVTNFPFQEEEDADADEDEDHSNNEAISSCFEQNLANIERTRHKLLQNIRRFESLAALDPVDLAESITNFEGHVPSSDEKDAAESGLIARLRSVGPHKELLTDFFEEELTWTDNVEELLTSAQSWILDEGHLTDNDYGRVQIKEMERNGRWGCFEDAKEDLAADMGVQILGLLVEDLVLDLLS